MLVKICLTNEYTKNRIRMDTFPFRFGTSVHVYRCNTEIVVAHCTIEVST